MDTTERAGFVRTSCDGDAALQVEVDSLLSALGEPETFLDRPILDHDEPGGQSDAGVGVRIGQPFAGYHVTAVIGAGGVGTVYLAEQSKPRRSVALKVLNRGVVTRSAQRRFEYETETLAQLVHPNIARIYETGTVEADGRRLPYFAMERIEGAHTITGYASFAGLGLRERVDLFARVCDAVHFAHQRGVIHRDLKPGNILVDGNGEPKIIDFGAARRADAETADRVATREGDIIGTLRYMSPEQCAGRQSAVDVRSDIYALGVVLFELLSGRLPHDLGDSSVYEAVRTITDTAPARPGLVDPALRGDVELILLKALDKEPDLRYQSAVELAADLRRYLNHEPVLARPPSTFYQVRLFARRNRAAFAAIVAVAVVLVAATAISTRFAIVAWRESQDRLLAEQAAQDERDVAQWEAYVGHVVAAGAMRQIGDYSGLRDNLSRATARHRGWEWRYIASRAEPASMLLDAHGGRMGRAVYRADGQRIATCSQDGTITVWDATTGALVRRWLAHDARALRIDWSPDGTRIVSTAFDRRIRIWDAEQGEQPIYDLEGHQSSVYDVRWSDDGRFVASGDDRGLVIVWDVATGAERVRCDTTPVPVEGEQLERRARGIDFAPDGATFAVASSGGEVTIWDAATGALRERLQLGERLRCVAWTPDARHVVAGSLTGVARVVELETMQVVDTFDHGVTLWTVAVSPDGRRLVTGGGDQRFRLWDMATGEMLRDEGGHTEIVRGAEFSPDGRMLVTAGWDGQARVWDLGVPAVQRWEGHDEEVLAITVSADGSRLASGDDSGRVVVRDGHTHETLRSFRPESRAVRALALSPDGSLLATGGGDRAVRIWRTDSADEKPIHELAGHDGSVYSLAFSPDGHMLVSGSRDDTVRLWNVDTGVEQAVADDHTGTIWALAWSPDGANIATASRDLTVVLRDATTLEPREIFGGHTDWLYAVAFSPNGRYLASGGRDQRIVIRDLETGEEHVLDGHGQFVTTLAFTPDGKRLVSTSWYRNIRLWDVGSWDEVMTLRDPEGLSIRAMAISPDGTRILTGGADSRVRVWDERGEWPDRE